MKSPYALKQSLDLRFVGDWGQANFHRICSWLTQEVCDQAGPDSRTAIYSLSDGGLDAFKLVHSGRVHMGVATPSMLLPHALNGTAMFEGNAMPELRAIATLPQNDKLVLAIDPKLGIRSFEELRAKKPALKIATSPDDGTNLIGFVAMRFMEAHGISEEELNSWGGSYVTAHRPEQSLFRMRDGEVDAVLQEAIMTPWWREVVEAGTVQPIPAEQSALDQLRTEFGFGENPVPPQFWTAVEAEIPALDFSDFTLVVRSDLDDDIARLLAWCVMEKREVLERQYRHIPPERSPLSYPLEPARMVQTPIPLHPTAATCYTQMGLLDGERAT